MIQIYYQALINCGPCRLARIVLSKLTNNQPGWYRTFGGDFSQLDHFSPVCGIVGTGSIA
jgi:hypothetical protein